MVLCLGVFFHFFLPEDVKTYTGTITMCTSIVLLHFDFLLYYWYSSYWLLIRNHTLPLIESSWLVFSPFWEAQWTCRIENCLSSRYEPYLLFWYIPSWNRTFFFMIGFTNMGKTILLLKMSQKIWLSKNGWIQSFKFDNILIIRIFSSVEWWRIKKILEDILICQPWICFDDNIGMKFIIMIFGYSENFSNI